jgi:hypothetical protein
MMRKIKKILVPIDFSEESVRALKYGDFLMSSVAVLEGSPFSANEFPTVRVDVLLRERSLDLWNFIGQAVEGNHHVKITKRLRMGSLVKEIAAIAQEEPIDLTNCSRTTKAISVSRSRNLKAF